LEGKKFRELRSPVGGAKWKVGQNKGGASGMEGIGEGARKQKADDLPKRRTIRGVGCPKKKYMYDPSGSL